MHMTPNTETSGARIARCHHGGYHLSIGNVTLHLNENELVLVARCVYAMAERNPDLSAKLVAGIVADRIPPDDE
jgi:hypothetical protein